MHSTEVGIIGGRGSMGRWFENYFKTSGCNVRVSDLDTPVTNTELATTCDLIVISTPVKTAVEIAAEIGPLMSKEQLLMDICSLKEDIIDSMLTHTEAEVIGTHPMFGPFTENIQGQNIILCPVRHTKWLNWVINIFEKKNAVVTCMDPTTHDKHMAIAQGLTHFLNICMGKMLKDLKMNPHEAIRYSTPIFRLNLDLIGRLFAQDLELYATLVGQNKYVKETLETFQKTMAEGCQTLLSDEKNQGLSFLENIRDFLGEFCQEGLKESSEALEALFKSQ